MAAAALVLTTVISTAERSSADTPEPIDPTSGQQNLLDLINSLPINDVQSALDHFPVPYVVCASAGGAAPTCVNQKAGSPQRLDADKSKVTGKGGDDIEVEVNTELLPTPHLRVNINRITSPADATHVQVVVAFPFAAFNNEALPAPNLFFGYETTNATGADGGIAPLTEEFQLTPNILAGTSHGFTLTMLTAGQVNPMRFQAGHFDGTTATGIQNAIGMDVYVQGTAPVVPNSIAMTLGTDENSIGAALTDSSLSLNWTASSAAKVIFNYLENEDFPFTTSDYATTLTFDQMPTSETIGLSLDEAAGTMHLTHSANAAIGTIQLLHKREDGLTITGTATDVPTSVDLAVDLNGTLTLDVNANTLDIDIVAEQTGGFFDTADFLGYNIGYAEVFLKNAPDLQAGYIPATDSFGIAGMNPGESIGALGFIIDDDGDLELPSRWGDESWHEFSLIDDGTHGTAAARVIDLQSALLTLDASPTGETFEFILGSRSPMQLHLETGPASALTGEDILAICEIEDMPQGDVDFTIDFPDQFHVDASPDHTQVIDSITCAGHVGTLNFELGVGGLPMNSGYKYDANGKLEVRVEPAGANSGFIGFITVRLWDETNPLPSPFVLPSLFGSAALHDTRMRSDHIPSFDGTWSDAPNTVISFDTGAPNALLFLGGVQVAVASEVGLSALAAASAGAHDFLTFTDEGPGGATTLKAGAFGIDAFSYTSTEATHALAMHYSADAPHQLDVIVDSRFGGHFFPEFDFDLTLTVDSIPATWDVTTDFATALDYTASAGLNSITLVGDIMSKEHQEDGANATFTGTTLHDTDSPFTANWAGGFVFAGANSAHVASNVPDELAVDAWTPGVPAGGTPYFIAAKTHINATMSGLPTHVEYALDPTVEGSAEIHMSNPITLVRAELTSDLKILSQPYKHMLLEVNNIPADWTAEWGLLPNPHASLSTSSPLGAVKVILSRATLADEGAQYAPFTAAGGNVAYSAFTREIDRRFVRPGDGDPDDREDALLGRLDSLYNSTSLLSSGEDHFIMRKNGAGDMSFLSIQGTGFQCAAAQIGPGSLQCGTPVAVNAGEVNASLALNFPGDHPFYVGMENEPDKFLTVAVPNIPDSVSAIVGASRALLDFDSQPGDILVYKGPLPTATDGTEALKVQLVGTPTSVHADWDLGFPGHVNVDTSNPLEFRLLTQSGNSRTIADFQVGDLNASWGLDAFTTDEKCQLDPPGCGEYLQFAKVSFNFSATPAIDGMILTYDRIGVEDLNPDSPAHGSNEFVPRVSFLLDGFSAFKASAQIELCAIGICAVGVLLPNIDIDIDLDGGFSVDFWDQGDDDTSFLGILGDPDYIANEPWHIAWPLLHSYASHVFPFGP